MEIIHVEAGPLATNAYVVYDKLTHGAVLIDAPLEVSSIFESIISENKLNVLGILLTHSHWDHSAEAAQLRRLTNAPIYIHPEDAYRLLDPNKHTIFQLPIDLEPAKPDVLMKHGDIIEIGNIKLEVRHTPGHTEGCVCFVNAENSLVFSGDTLFSGSVGRIDLPGGSKENLINSINNSLLTLGDNFKVYPGHGDSTSIGSERRNNIYILNSDYL
ncbi:MAG: MBL fold metallo-hydrolase [Candidatus Kapabacteria bacterium]|nr:MBL fold metallo-hydrolase [Candidatus Kapabacteria bacterium]